MNLGLAINAKLIKNFQQQFRKFSYIIFLPGQNNSVRVHSSRAKIVTGSETGSVTVEQRLVQVLKYRETSSSALEKKLQRRENSQGICTSRSEGYRRSVIRLLKEQTLDLR